MSRNPTMAEVISRAVQDGVDEVLVSVVGRVVRYDVATQSADVQPTQKVRHFDEDGASVVVQLPVIPSVPVEFPGGGAFTITFPIEVGDTVLLVFSGLSMDKWLQGSTDEPLDPETHARHALSDAVAIPGIRRFTNARASMPTDHVRIGTDSGTAQGAALGETLASFLASLKTWLDTHVHPDPASGFTGAPTVASTSVPDVASDTVKVTP